jgi:N-acyl-D-aspartate/D-glutamate deacylase
MDAGLCGFSIQRLGRNSTQADFDGTPMVTDTMVDEDILALAEVLAERDEGFIQITQATGKIKQDLAFVERLAAVSRRPVIHNAIAPTRRNPDPHRKSLEWLARCWQQGLRVYGQCATVRSGFVFSLEDWNLYDFAKTWRALTTGTHDEKLTKMADPELRQAMVEAEIRNKAIYRKLRPGVGGPIEDLVVQGVARKPELQKYVGRSLEDIGAEEGKHPGEVMLDLSLATDLKAEFLGPDKGSNADFMAELMEVPYTLPGVSDGGAHTKFFTGGAWPTDFLKWLVRDEEKLTLEEAHFRLSALPAHAAGFRDRGVLREGAAADIVVYDMEELDMDPQWTGDVAHDLPGGEWRRVQRAKGYKEILVNGEVTFSDGECTGATPGRLLRHGRG